MMKIYKFKIDDWVSYSLVPGSQSASHKQKAVVLEVLENDSFYDYRIFIDGRGTITKVREEDLFPYEETT